MLHFIRLNENNSYAVTKKESLTVVTAVSVSDGLSELRRRVKETQQL